MSSTTENQNLSICICKSSQLSLGLSSFSPYISVASTLQKTWKAQLPPSQRGQTQFVSGGGCKPPNTHLESNSRSHQSQNKISRRFWKGSPHCQQPVSLCTAWPCTWAFDTSWPPIFISECCFVAFLTRVAFWLKLLPLFHFELVCQAASKTHSDDLD